MRTGGVRILPSFIAVTMGTDMQIVLQVFAKAPVPGQVKTRLRSAWGAQGACFWYQRLLAATVHTAVYSEVAQVELCCAPNRAHAGLRRLAGRYGLPLRVQPRGKLGDRMLGAARRVLRYADAVIIIGADCTPLTQEYLQASAAALAEGSDVVLVPAADGGYVLIGLRLPVAGLFQGVCWGSDRVLQQTRNRIRRANLRVLELPVSWDVDRPANIHRLLRAGRLRHWGRC